MMIDPLGVILLSDDHVLDAFTVVPRFSIWACGYYAGWAACNGRVTKRRLHHDALAVYMDLPMSRAGRVLT